jgi:hypothetical protein
MIFTAKAKSLRNGMDGMATSAILPQRQAPESISILSKLLAGMMSNMTVRSTGGSYTYIDNVITELRQQISSPPRRGEGWVNDGAEKKNFSQIYADFSADFRRISQNFSAVMPSRH